MKGVRTTTSNRLRISRHGRQRQQQRGVPRSRVEMVIDFGRVYRNRNGRIAYFLGQRGVRDARRRGFRVEDAKNTAVVVAADGTVVTVISSADCKRLRRAGWR